MVKDYIICLDKVELTLVRSTDNEESGDLFNMPIEPAVDLFSVGQSCYNMAYKSGEFTLTHNNGLNRMYNFSYTVYYGVDEIGTVLLDNRISKEYISLKIKNELLYDSEYFYEVVNKFLVEFNLQINNFSALDIAIDCRKNLIKLFDKYYEDEANYHFVSNCRRSDNEDGEVSEFNQKKRNGEKNISYYIGKKDSGKQVCIYNKSKQLETVSKPYISDLHNQLSGVKDVYRFELRLKNSYVSKYQDKIDYHRIFDVNYLKDIMNRCLDRFIDFRLKYKNYRPTQCQKVELFDLTTAGSAKVLIPLKKNKTKLNNTSKEDRTFIKLGTKKAMQKNSHKDLMYIRGKAIECNQLDYFEELTKGVKLDKKEATDNTGYTVDLSDSWVE